MTSTPKMEYQVFLYISQKNLAIATLNLKEMGKFLLKGRKKSMPCWLFQFSRTKNAMPLFFLDNLLKKFHCSTAAFDSVPKSQEKL